MGVMVLSWTFVAPGHWEAYGGSTRYGTRRHYKLQKSRTEPRLWQLYISLGYWYPWTEIDWAATLNEGKGRADQREIEERQAVCNRRSERRRRRSVLSPDW